ncbi:response regulator [Caballeronia arationis]|uniref:response regulator n=1 Tax=Caballeronia arationis TaxID=1777142 RepID=UPI00074C1442|nr:response regulator [Caballeronia arationis]SAL06933.1 response regulator [Caballeronia arationis]
MRKKLLLADDDLNATAAVAVFFESHNFEVRTATDEITALRWFSTWQPDAAMLDIDMPGANGYEVAQHVRRTENPGKRTLLVAITGEMPPHEVAARCHEAGFDLHVAKPADVKALAEFVNLSFRHDPSRPNFDLFACTASLSCGRRPVIAYAKQ